MNRYFGLHTLEGEWHALLPRYLFLADRIEGARILDIGCGSGLGSSLLLELGATAVDAIDHRPAVLELARMKHAKDGLDFHVMLWEELDFPDETFDIILCLDPSSPVTDPNLLREVRRVLKPGGEYICAIERKTVQGFERLLPRYGYTDMAEHVDINEAGGRVPQIGEISRHFSQIFAIVQRPQYGFAFDYANLTQHHEPATEEARRLDGGEEALTLNDASGQDGAERWLTVDKRFCTNESEIAGVELWLCGDEDLAFPALREIRLPYYSLAERLQMLIHDLHTRQRKAREAPELFSEVVDNEQDIEDSKTTAEMERPSLEDMPTQVRARPTPPASARVVRPSLQLEQLDAHLAELDALHRRIKTDFDRLFFETRALFDEREHGLRDAIEALRPQPMPPSDDHVTALEARVRQLEEELAATRAELERRDAPLEPPSLEDDRTIEFQRIPVEDLVPEERSSAAEDVIEAIVEAADADEAPSDEPTDTSTGEDEAREEPEPPADEEQREEPAESRDDEES